MNAEIPAPINPGGNEYEPQAGLSINGNQLHALILSRTLTNNRRGPDDPLDLVDALIVANRQDDAVAVLRTLPPTGDSESARSQYGVRQSEVIEALEGAPRSVKEVVDTASNLSLPDRDFIRSLPGSRLDSDAGPSLPEAVVFLPELGNIGWINPRENSLTLRLQIQGDTTYYSPSDVMLPLNEQRPIAIGPEDVYGTPEEAAQSKREVLERLRQTYPTIYTHVTSSLPAILASGYLGKYYPSKRLEGFYAATFETSKLDDPDPEEQWPLYVREDRIQPIAIFDGGLVRRREGGTLFRGTVSMSDPNLIGYWVMPNYKKHILHWINGWDEEQRQRVFGDIDPAPLLISSADDLLQREEQRHPA